MDLADHFYELCADNGIIVRTPSPYTVPESRLTNTLFSYAMPAISTVCIHPIRGGYSYAVAMHEAGHVMCRHILQPWTARETLKMEKEAWAWAKEHSLPIPAIDRVMKTALHSYQFEVDYLAGDNWWWRDQERWENELNRDST